MEQLYIGSGDAGECNCINICDACSEVRDRSETCVIPETAHGYCACWACSDCGEAKQVTDSKCDTCYACEECCQCWECARCNIMQDRDNARCRNCDMCEGCCECWECPGCGRHRDHDERSCNACEGCENCCDCLYCESCNENHYRDTAFCFECQSCQESCECTDTIRPYSTDVTDTHAFLGTPVGRIFLGVELEVEVPRGTGREESAAYWLGEHGEWTICKEDASLARGYEIVTAPMSLAEHQGHWPSAIGDKSWSDHVSSWDTSTCGLHVHVSRDPLTALTIGKIVCFVNSLRTRNQIITLAGRNVFYNGDYQASKSIKEEGSILKNLECNSRYEAVNLMNQNTIEFRIFKGTLDLQHILANVEFCDALCRWSADVPIADCDDWDLFMAYVTAHAGTYPNLISYHRE